MSSVPYRFPHCVTLKITQIMDWRMLSGRFGSIDSGTPYSRETCKNRWDEAAGRHATWWHNTPHNTRSRASRKVVASHAAYWIRFREDFKSGLHHDRGWGID
jgi:hypothetical protein